MANNIDIDEGADRTVATDEIGGVNYQVMKLADGAEDGSDRISGDAANGLDVDVTRVADGADVALGATTDAKVDTDAQGTVSAKLRGLVSRVVELLALLPASIGQKTKAGSLAVTLASDEDDIGVDALPADTFAAEEAALGKGVLVQGDDGTDRHNVQVNASGQLEVDVAAQAVGALEMQGDAAHDAAIAGNPVRVGGRAVNSELAAVANGDAVDLVATLAGKLVNLPYANPEQQVSGTAGPITDTSTTQVIAAQGADVKIYITEVLVTNGDDTTPTLVTIQDEDDNALWKGWAQDNGGGYAQTFRIPIPVTANKAIEAVCGTAGATVYVSVNGDTGA